MKSQEAPTCKAKRPDPEAFDKIYAAFNDVSGYYLHELLESMRDYPDQKFDLNWIYPIDSLTALQCAIAVATASGSFANVFELLKAGADPAFYAETTKSPLLMIASGISRLEERAKCAFALIDGGASCTDIDASGMTVLMYACKYGDRRFFEAIWGESAKSTLAFVDDHGFTALHHLGENRELATFNTIAAICEFPFNPNILPVLDMGLESDDSTQCGNIFQVVLASPLERAIGWGCYEMAAALLRFGAVPIYRDHIHHSKEEEIFYTLLSGAYQLYGQCKDEIITFMLHAYNPRNDAHLGYLRDIFQHIWPYLRYRSRIGDLYAEYQSAVESSFQKI